MNEIFVERRHRHDREAPATLTFFFDPLCPWAWRASQWIREVQRQERLDVRWEIFSLAEANGLDPDLYLPVRVLSLVDRREGNEAVGRLYRALGTLIHESEADSRAPGALEALTRQACEEIDLDASIVDEAMSDQATLDGVQLGNQLARERFGTYGVPWLVVGGSQFGFNGPVIDAVPRNETAVQLWHHLSWLLTQPYLYEVKRERGVPVPAGRS